MTPYYKSCKDLPIYYFFEIIESKNLNWLVKDYDGSDREAESILKETWENIFDEYLNLKNDESIKEHYRVISEVAELEQKMVFLDQLTYLFGTVTSKSSLMDVCKALSTIGYPVDGNKSRIEEYERLKRNKKGLNTNITRKKLEHKNIFDNEEKEVKRNYEKDVADVEFILGKNYIDTKKVSVSRWVIYLEQVTQKVKANGRK